MASERHNEFGFVPSYDAPIPYLQRIRSYYQALGYGAPYEWAHFSEVPFKPLAKPLSQSHLTIITTAAPFQADKGDQGPGAPYNAAAKFYTVYSGDTASHHDLRISHLAIDRKHTTAEDMATYFPLEELRRSAASGRVGSLAARFHGVPTNRSHRVTLGIDCPEIVARCKVDAVDAAILVPNCPVCHQTVSLTARMLEENGIATVVMGAASALFRLPAGQRRGPAEGPRFADAHARVGAEGPRNSTGGTHDRAVTAQMERRSGLETRLLQHRAHDAR